MNGVIEEVELATGKVLYHWESLDHVAITESHATVGRSTLCSAQVCRAEGWSTRPRSAPRRWATPQRLDDGNLFVGWGTAKRVSEFSDDGTLLFDATLPDVSYRALREVWHEDSQTILARE